MNIGYEDDELKPYQEPSRDCTDPVRIGLCRECYYLYSSILCTMHLCIPECVCGILSFIEIFLHPAVLRGLSLMLK